MTPVVLERVMAITRDEFLRLFPMSLEHDERLQAGGDTLVVESPSGHVSIEIRQLPDTMIASLRLPSLHVKMSFESHILADHFLARFDRTFQRGGG